MIPTKLLGLALTVLLLTLCCHTDALPGKISKLSSNDTTTITNTATSVASKTAAKVKAATTTLKPATAEEADDDDDNDDASSEEVVADDEKTAVQPAEEATSLSVWGIVRSVWHWIRDDLGESLLGDDGTKSTAVAEGRTFGKIRRLQMAIIPLIFKFGILTAMVAFLVVLGMKTLFLVKVLVVMNAIAILAKFLTLKTSFGQEHSAPTWGTSYSNWSPHMSGGWAASAPAAAPVHQPSKEIHLHIHGAHGQPQVASYSTYGTAGQGQHGWESRSDAYAGYGPSPVSEAELENELNNDGPMPPQLSASYARNHRTH